MIAPGTKTSRPVEVDIVMPCYNAAAWLDDCLAGLATVADYDWRLLARDDGSSDDTRLLLRQWRDRLSPRMVILDDDGPSSNLGVADSFNRLLLASTAPWVMTLDPDDIWMADHGPLTLEALREAEASFGAETPIAVCTDAVVVDSNLGFVAPSFWGWLRTRVPRSYSVAGVSMDSVALGSTMAVNRALLRAALPIARSSGGQDWWMALVAVALGRLVVLDAQTIRYRRHDANFTASPLSNSLASVGFNLPKVWKLARGRLNLLIRQSARQAEAFARDYGDRIHPDDLAALLAVTRLQSMGPLARRLAIIRHGLWFNSFTKNVGLLALI